MGERPRRGLPILRHLRYEALFHFAQRVARRLQGATRKKAVGFVAFGTGLPHAHLHLVPMDTHEVLLKPQPVALSESTLAEHAHRLRPHLADLRGQFLSHPLPLSTSSDVERPIREVELRPP
jgi:diadenosine tetraphosphate (Ap4A) HIT family hydrolase